MVRRKKDKKPSPVEYELIAVDPKQVAFNTDNPRRESAEQIDSDPEFTQLVDSVHEFGVLVPIVVHPQTGKGKKKYRLVDGERRLRAALKTNQPTVPAHVAGHGTTELMQAFHIHMLRKQWGRTAQTRAVKRIMKELRQRIADPESKEFFTEMQSLTGYTKSQLSSLLHATKYTDKVLADVDNKVLLFSHLIQFEESFIEPVKQHYPSLVKEFGAPKLRTVLIRKAKRKVLSRTRALMDNIVPVISRAQNREEKAYVEHLLRDFLENPDLSAEEVRKQFDRKFPESETGLLDLLERTIANADSLEQLVRRLPGTNSMLSFSAKTMELYNKLDSLKKVMAEKRKIHKSILR